MLRNYFIIAIRNFQRHFGYTIINAAGLTVGLTTFLFLLLWVQDELAFDSFHENQTSLYKVWHNSVYSDGTIKTFPSTSSPVAIAAKETIPEVEYATRMDWGSELLFTYNNNSSMQKGIWADPVFFKMFTFPVIKGDPENPLPDNNAVAISEKLAKVYFRNENPIGKVFRVAEYLDMRITAVFKNVPANSSLQFDFVLPFSVYENDRTFMKGNWEVSSNQTFIKLREGSSVEAVNEKLTELVKKNCAACLVNPFLQLYKDFHLYSNFKDGKQAGGTIEYVRAFAIVAIFILVIACINFTNLATARASTRFKEVGVRKVVGAQRKNLMLQFIGESLLITAASMVLALAFVQLTLPFFNELINKQISLELFDFQTILMLLGIVVLTGILAGSYPAFFLSSFKPVSVLKGISNSVKGESLFRKGLVVFQFSLSVVLLSGSAVVYYQIRFIQNKNLGIDRENIVSLDIRGAIQKNLEAFKLEALKQPGVLSMSATTEFPFDVQNTTSDPVWPGKQKDQVIPFKVITGDADLIPTLGISMLEGRNFNADTKADTANYIVNEAAVHAMGLQDPVGTPFEMWYGKGKIIGVVKDFHNQNFRSSIDPLVLAYYPSNTWRLFIKLDGTHLQESLQQLHDTYKKFESVYPFDYWFLDQQFNNQYQREITTGKLATYFTVIAIFISCLGLFGLASFTAERRTKELGVRKVLGASTTSLVTLLCGDLTKLVVIALFIGTPVAYFLTDNFLSQYIFHTDLNFWTFGAAAVSILLIALFTVIFQAVKSASNDPVRSLKTE